MAIKIKGITVIPDSAGVTSTGSASLGYNSLSSLTTGVNNTTLGNDSGSAITTGSNNTIIGSLAGTSNLSDTVLIGAGTTERIKVDSTGLYINGSAFQGGATITDDTTTNGTRYLLFDNVTSGTSTSIGVSSTKLTYNPSTGTLSATVFSGSGASLTNLNASNISSGTVAAGYLGTGTTDSTTYLRGDNTWQTLNKTAVGLGNVENTALSNWAGSTNITTIGAATASSLTVTGDLTINGTTTTINATTLTVDDKNIELGAVTTPTDTTANGGGITLKGATDKTIIWDSTNSNWTSSENWNLASGKVLKINNTQVLSSTAIGALNGSALTSLTAGNLSGTIPSAVLGNSTHYIGTTAITLNRASASQALTGITSIDGNAATASQLNTTSYTAYTDWTANNLAIQYYNVAGAPDGSTFSQGIQTLYSSDTTYGWQMVMGTNNDNNVYFRKRKAGAFNAWQTLLSAGNYNSYSPTLTGTGASGTWGINISGTATTATTANALNTANTYTVASLIVGNTINSTITMVDTDEGNRQIHCNSNRIGYLNSGGAWGSYCPDDGSWWTDNYMYSASYVSTGDHYYLRSAGGERQVRWQQTGRDVYIYCRDSDKLMGVYDTVGGGRWTSDASGNFVAVGNVTAYSDPRLKENVDKINDPFSILHAINGYTFTWKHGITATQVKAGKKDYGMMADQVEAVMPEIVTEMPSYDESEPSYKTVAYEKLVPVLLEALKQLEARVKELESK